MMGLVFDQSILKDLRKLTFYFHFKQILVLNIKVKSMQRTGTDPRSSPQNHNGK